MNPSPIFPSSIPHVTSTTSIPESPRTQCSRVERMGVRRADTDASKGSRLHLGSLFSATSSGANLAVEPTCRRSRRVCRDHPRLVAACVVMVATGVVLGMVVEGWSFLTSLYVIVQIITTIGFGDVTVQAWSMQLFMAFYVLLSLLIVANFLNIMIGAIIQQHVANFQAKLQKMEVATDGTLRNSRDAQRKFGHLNDVLISSLLFGVAILSGMLFYGLAENCTCSYGVTQEAYGKEDCRDESYASCMETGGFQHSWVTAFYMSVITITTVGFGDFTPKSHWGRLFGLVWMTLGVAATGTFIRAVSAAMADCDPATNVEGAEGIDEQIFQEIDKNGDGFLTKAEYTRYILLKHGFLPRDVLREIDQKYDSMDMFRTGRVTMEMITMKKTRSLPLGQVVKEKTIE
eukprot:TRINITY_DN3288_c0_g1_i1.p1 TRINITY_DN3288_c0_g1~~TRINITY_DN3288_c0_g1_i1.p1  ORF type:complete len:403 (+),score=74.67 TRINITY_DN3288_c0_g1_i1:110-1318(+)